jgi:circadian clock protein KaiC
MHHGLEMHLATIQRMVKREKPSAVIIDPISNLESVGSAFDVSAMLIRLVDFLKLNGITGLFISLTSGGGSSLEKTDVGMSSVMDSWLLLRDIELNGERNRGLYVLKSRGMSHSNQIREFLISDKGIDLVNVYLGPEGVLTGSARVAQEQQELSRRLLESEEVERRRSALERRRRALEAQIATLQAELESENFELNLSQSSDKARQERISQVRDEMAKIRGTKSAGANGEIK